MCAFDGVLGIMIAIFTLSALTTRPVVFMLYLLLVTVTPVEKEHFSDQA